MAKDKSYKKSDDFKMIKLRVEDLLCVKENIDLAYKTIRTNKEDIERLEKEFSQMSQRKKETKGLKLLEEIGQKTDQSEYLTRQKEEMIKESKNRAKDLIDDVNAMADNPREYLTTAIKEVGEKEKSKYKKSLADEFYKIINNTMPQKRYIPEEHL